MKKSYIIASAALGAILVASPAYADQDKHRDGRFAIELGGISGVFDRKESREKKEDRKEDRKDARKHAAATSSVAIHGTVTAISGSTITLTGKNGAVLTVDASAATFDDVSLADIRVGDTIKVKGTVSGTVIAATKVSDKDSARREFVAKLNDLRVGIVTAVTPTGFTIARFGSGTTTVTTNASTTIKAPGKNGTSTIGVGTKVIVAGSTSTPDSITANFVLVLNKGLGWLKHWFGR